MKTSVGDDARIREALESVGVGTLVQVLQDLGVFRTFMQGVLPRTGVSHFSGRARTLRTVPMREDVLAERRKAPRDEDPHRRAIEETGPGEVLVIDARSNIGAAVVGDLLAERVLAAGGTGVVTDGCVRDAPGLTTVDIAVFASGYHASTFPNQHIAADINVVIGCAEVLVSPGDFIVGDPEGVVVIPASHLDEAVRLAVTQEARDEFLRVKIRGGARLAEAYPPSDRVMAEFRAQQAAKER